MRRVNALENLYNYTIDSTNKVKPKDLTGPPYDSISAFTSDGISNVYYLDVDDTSSGTALRKAAYPFTSGDVIGTEIVSPGTATDGSDGIRGGGAMACDGSHVYVCDTHQNGSTRYAYIKKFDLTGTKVADYSVSSTSNWPTFAGITVLADGSLIYQYREVTGTKARKVYSIDSGLSSPSEIISYNFTTTTNGEIYDFWLRSVVGHIGDDNYFSITVKKYNETTDSLLIYNKSGTLQQTVTKPTATAPPDYCNVVIAQDSRGRFWGHAYTTVVSELSLFKSDFTLARDDVFGGAVEPGVIVSGSQVTNLWDNDTETYAVDYQGASAAPGRIREYVNDVTAGDLTDFHRYPTPGNDTGKVSLGTPDYGVSVPAANALQGYTPHYFELRDIRDAIEAVCVNYENPATNAAYTTTAGTNNIFRVAIDSGQDDWTTPSVTHGDAITDEHWNDIELVLTQLEASELA
jgi:hypothetical protein